MAAHLIPECPFVGHIMHNGLVESSPELSVVKVFDGGEYDKVSIAIDGSGEYEGSYIQGEISIEDAEILIMQLQQQIRKGHKGEHENLLNAQFRGMNHFAKKWMNEE